MNDYLFSEPSQAEDGRTYNGGRALADYFSDFAKNMTKEIYDEMDENERPALILINNPKEFKRRFF